MGAHETVAIADLAARNADLVDHGIAIERVMATERLVHRVFGVAQIYAVNVQRHFAFDHFQRVNRYLFVQRSPGAGEIGVVRWLERVFQRCFAGDLHRLSSPAK